MRTLASKDRGFTYVGLLFAVMLIGLMLTVVARVWRTTVQREREAQLLWVGHAYRMAISSYFAFGHRYPATLQNLILDERFPEPKHHLRQLYPDPMTGKPDWTLLLTPNQSGIEGIASSSQAAPIKRDGFDLIDTSFKNAKCYCTWKFVYYANRWGAGVDVSLPGAPLDTSPAPSTPGTQPPGTTTAPGIPLPLLNNNPAPPPPSPPPDSGQN
jgi:type II secretory pathway pseudopilin PulG